MKRVSLVSVSAVAVLAAAISFLALERSSPGFPPAPTANAEGAKLLGRLPVAFVPNLGQWDHAARYVARFGGMTVFLQEQGWTFTLAERSQGQTEGMPARHRMARADLEPKPVQGRGVAVRMTFAGASEPVLAAEDVLPGRHNYFLGNDPAKWRSDVPLYASVRYREVHPGVDVRAREHDGHFEYDLLLQPGAQLELVEIAVEGIEQMHVDESGALVMETRLGPVRMPAPLSWEEGPLGEKCPVTCRYVLQGDACFGFEVTGRRPAWALVVDPGLIWSTFLGGSGAEGVEALALDAQGAVTVAGWTFSTDFPTTPGAFDTTYNGDSRDAFVTRISPNGSSLVYSTFLGGGDTDYAYAIALDAPGAATVVGATWSYNFPTTQGAFDTTHEGLVDAFVIRLSPTGSSLVYSTFLGGGDTDYAYAIALDAPGAATVAGWTQSIDFPTTPGAFDRSYNSGDAFVTRLDMLPTGVSAFGRSSPGCTGALAIGVTSMPRIGNTGLALACGNAPPNALGLLALTGHRFPSPVIVLGVEVWVDPTLVLVPLPARSNNIGASEVSVPIPGDPTLAGARLFAQFFWAGTPASPPCPPQGLSASNALDITIQP